MISGVSSGGSPLQPFITGIRPVRTAAPAPEARAEPQEPELSAPSGDEAQLTHEYTMLDLASRQFARVLPKIEQVTEPVE